MKNKNTQIQQQLELTIGNPAQMVRPCRRQRKLPGAQWWFSQMRLAAERGAAARQEQGSGREARQPALLAPPSLSKAA